MYYDILCLITKVDNEMKDGYGSINVNNGISLVEYTNYCILNYCLQINIVKFSSLIILFLTKNCYLHTQHVLKGKYKYAYLQGHYEYNYNIQAKPFLKKMLPFNG